MYRLFLTRNIETQRTRVGDVTRGAPQLLDADLESLFSSICAGHRDSDAAIAQAVDQASRAFPSWNRPILTEIYLCHDCSYHEVEDGNAWAGGGRRGRCCPGGLLSSLLGSARRDR
eukprot:COSAG01_NODE_3499_length_6004_cov_2.645047_2_plen_116_part_00